MKILTLEICCIGFAIADWVANGCNQAYTPTFVVHTHFLFICLDGCTMPYMVTVTFDSQTPSSLWYKILIIMSSIPIYACTLSIHLIAIQIASLIHAITGLHAFCQVKIIKTATRKWGNKNSTDSSASITLTLTLTLTPKLLNTLLVQTVQVEANYHAR